MSAAVIGFPGKMPGSRVDDLGIVRIDGNRLDFVNFFAAGGTDLAPVQAVVGAAIDAAQRAGNQDARIGQGLSQRSHGLAAHVGRFGPGAAFVVTDVNAAVRMVDAPRHRRRAVFGSERSTTRLSTTRSSRVPSRASLDQEDPPSEETVDPAVGGAEIDAARDRAD